MPSLSIEFCTGRGITCASWSDRSRSPERLLRNQRHLPHAPARAARRYAATEPASGCAGACAGAAAADGGSANLSPWNTFAFTGGCTGAVAGAAGRGDSNLNLCNTCAEEPRRLALDWRERSAFDMGR
jgi:hypothetical protein